jgi:hypothetical protein
MPITLEAYTRLLEIDLYQARHGFAALRRKVSSFPVAPQTALPETVKAVCEAVDLACIWYWKEVRCLQRSAATTCLLKRRGVRAEMIIGAQHTPFKAHAWVEVNGFVVNDKPYMRELYSVLDAC